MYSYFRIKETEQEKQQQSVQTNEPTDKLDMIEKQPLSENSTQNDK